MGLDGFARLALMAVAVTAMAGAPLRAELRDIKGTTGKEWGHQPTNIAFPAAIAGIARSRILDSTKAEWDVFGNYQSTDGNDFVSLYVYETQLPDATIAFDEALKSIRSRPANDLENFGNIGAVAPALSFALAGQEVKAGWRQTFALNGANMRSTAIAVAPFGGSWLLKVRVSSRSRSATELDALLSQVLAEWGLPKDKVKQPEARPTLPCATPQSILPRSENVKFGTTQALMNVALGPAGGNVERLYGNGSPKPVYCLDSSLASGFSVYRSPDRVEQYIVPISDNGMFVQVEQDVLGSLLAFDPADPGAVERKKADPDYTVSIFSPGATLVLLPQTTLPPPQQALELVAANKWVVNATRTQKNDEKIDINPEFIDAADKRLLGF